LTNQDAKRSSITRALKPSFYQKQKGIFIMLTKFSNQPISQSQPQNIEAEEAILGGVLLDSQALDRVVNILKPEMFFVNAHASIYKAFLALKKQMKPTDLMTVSSYLTDNKLIEKIGGQQVLINLVGATVSTVNIDYYARIVADKWLRRQVVGMVSEISSLGWDQSVDTEFLLRRVEEKTHEILKFSPYADQNAQNIQEYQCARLLEQINKIQLEVDDPVLKEFMMHDLAKNSGRSQGQLHTLFFKSLIASENEKSMSLSELKEEYGNEVREWLLHGFIPKATTTLIHALGGKGKTRLMYDFIYSLASGQEWQGFNVTKQAKILIIQTDEQPADMTAALEMRGINESFNISYKTKWSIDHIPQLYKEVEREQYDLILIDSLASISKFSTVSENDAEFARPILLLNKIACDFGTSIIMIHHSSKQGEARGTTATYNAVSQVLQLKSDPNNNRPDSLDRILLIQKSRARRPASYKLEFNPEDGSWRCLGEDNQSTLSGVDPLQGSKDVILNFLENNKGKKYENHDLAESVGLNVNTVRRVTFSLRQDGLISWRKSGQKNHYWIDGVVTKLNYDHPDQGGDHKVITEVISSQNQGAEQGKGTRDHVITQNQKISQKISQKKSKKGDHVIKDAGKAHRSNNVATDHPTDHRDQSLDQSDQSDQTFGGYGDNLESAFNDFWLEIASLEWGEEQINQFLTQNGVESLDHLTQQGQVRNLVTELRKVEKEA
jgi:replicative DNA helicase